MTCWLSAHSATRARKLMAPRFKSSRVRRLREKHAALLFACSLLLFRRSFLCRYPVPLRDFAKQTAAENITFDPSWRQPAVVVCAVAVLPARPGRDVSSRAARNNVIIPCGWGGHHHPRRTVLSACYCIWLVSRLERGATWPVPSGSWTGRRAR